MIAVEVEDEAWREIVGVEARVKQAAKAALTSQNPSPPRALPHRKSEPSLPLGGGGVGVGVLAPTSPEEVGAAPPVLFHRRPAPTPIPDPSPIEGEGGRHAAGLPSRGKAFDVAVLLTDDASVRALNARFRSKDAATNVLSFPAAESARPHLGDIALAFGVCAAEAADQGKPIAHHLAHLVVHGVLHLLGYDHEADADAEVMEAEEGAILSRLGIADPYGRGTAHV